MSKLTEQIENMNKDVATIESCSGSLVAIQAHIDYVSRANSALAEAVELEGENERLLNSVILIKDKARLPLTTKSEVIEDLQKLIAKQALKESEDG